MSQFADDSMTPSPISVSRDKQGNEIPSDRPMHDEATPGRGSFDWTGNQYDDSPGKSGFGSYGVSVDSNKGAEKKFVNGMNPSRGGE